MGGTGGQYIGTLGGSQFKLATQEQFRTGWAQGSWMPKVTAAQARAMDVGFGMSNDGCLATSATFDEGFIPAPDQ